MAEEATFTLKLEPELRERFLAEAAAASHAPSQLVRDFMQDFIEAQRRTREHDAWFRTEVERGIRQADDPQVEPISA